MDVWVNFMAHKTKINGTIYDINGGSCKVNGTKYNINKGKTKINGTGYDITFGKSLSSYAEGDIVNINEYGAPVEFYVAKHDYETRYNGAGRTLLLRKNVTNGERWNANGTSSWENSTLRSLLNREYIERLDVNILDLIAKTSYLIYYRGYSTTLSDTIFLLSCSELGYTGTFGEGNVLPTADLIRIATREDNFAVPYWTRTTETLNSMPYYVSGTGTFSTYYPNYTYSIRPAFTLPSSIAVDDNNLIK